MLLFQISLSANQSPRNAKATGGAGPPGVPQVRSGICQR